MKCIYNLELTESEMLGLWALLVMLDSLGILDDPEKPILRKVDRLIEEGEIMTAEAMEGGS